MSISTTVKKVENFIVSGFSVRTQNKDEFNHKTAKLPSLWQQFYASILATNTKVYGVYSNYDSDVNGFYTVTAGVESSGTLAELSTVNIQAGNYLVFEGKGLMPAAVVEAWERVWEFFKNNTEYRRNFISDFEVYSGCDKVEVFIGLQIV